MNDVYFPDSRYSKCDLFPAWVRLRPEILEYVFHNETLSDWFAYLVCNPRSLINRCVITIRQLLGPKQFVQNVKELPLPCRLRDMVYITSSVKTTPGF